MGASTTVATTYQVPDNPRPSATDVADRTWADSGLRPTDIDVASIYDNFTPTILFSLEAFEVLQARLRVGSSCETVGSKEAGELPVEHQRRTHLGELHTGLEPPRGVGAAGAGESANQVSKCDYAHYMCYSPIVTSIVFSKA